MKTRSEKAAGPSVTSIYDMVITGNRPDAHNYKRAEELNEYIQKQLGE